MTNEELIPILQGMFDSLRTEFKADLFALETKLTTELAATEQRLLKEIGKSQDTAIITSVMEARGELKEFRDQFKSFERRVNRHLVDIAESRAVAGDLEARIERLEDSMPSPSPA